VSMEEFTAAAGRVSRAQLRALLRDGRYATLPSAGTRKHSEAAVGACGCVQLEPDSTQAAGSGYAAGAEESPGEGVLAIIALSAVPDDNRFA
jgi:hypothetical protein